MSTMSASMKSAAIMDRGLIKSRRDDKTAVSNGAPSSSARHQASDSKTETKTSRWSNSNSKFNKLLGNIERSILGQFSGSSSDHSTGINSPNTIRDISNDKIARAEARSNKQQQASHKRRASNGSASSRIVGSGDAGATLSAKDKGNVTSLVASLAPRLSSAKSPSEVSRKLTLCGNGQHPAGNLMAGSQRLSIPPPHANNGARMHSNLLFANDGAGGSNEAAPMLLGFGSSAPSKSSHDTNQASAVSQPQIVPNGNECKQSMQEGYANSMLRAGSSPASSARSLPVATLCKSNLEQRSQQRTIAEQAKQAAINLDCKTRSRVSANEDAEEESGFSTYQSRRSLQTQSAQMFPQRLNAVASAAITSNQNNGNVMFSQHQHHQQQHPTVVDFSHVSSGFSLQHNSGNFLQQQQQQQQQLHHPQQLSFPYSHNDHQQSYSAQLHSQQYNQQFNKGNLQAAHFFGQPSNQVPIQSGLGLAQHPSNNLAASQHFSTQPRQQQFATLDHNVQRQRQQQQQQHQAIRPNQLQPLQQRALIMQHTGNNPNLLAAGGGQKIYANAPPKPRRYLYYDNINQNSMMTQLPALINSGGNSAATQQQSLAHHHHHQQQQQQLGLPQKTQSYYNLTQISAPNLYQANRFAYQGNQSNASQLDVPAVQRPQLIKSKSNLDAADLVRMRQARQASQQQQQQQQSLQQSMLRAPFVSSNGGNNFIQKSYLLNNQQDLHRPFQITAGALQRSKSVTHLSPESDNQYPRPNLPQSIDAQHASTAHHNHMQQQQQQQQQLSMTHTRVNLASSASTNHINLIGMSNQIQPVTAATLRSQLTGIMKHASSHQLDNCSNEPLARSHINNMPYNTTAVGQSNNSSLFLNRGASQTQPPPAFANHNRLAHDQQSNILACPNSNRGAVPSPRTLISGNNRANQNPLNCLPFSGSGASTVNRSAKHSISSYNHMTMQVQENSNAMNNKSSLDDKIRHLLIGADDKGGASRVSATLSAHIAPDAAAAANVASAITGPHEQNNGAITNHAASLGACDNAAAISATKSSSLQTYHLSQHNRQAAWTNRDFVRVAAASRHQASSSQFQQSLPTSERNSVNVSGPLNKYASVKSEQSFEQSIDAARIDRYNIPTESRPTDQADAGPQSFDQSKLYQAVDQCVAPTSPTATAVTTSDAFEMGSRQSRQCYQLAPDDRHHTRVSATSNQDDLINSQLIVDLTTPRVLAKTQTTLVSSDHRPQTVARTTIDNSSLDQQVLTDHQVRKQSEHSFTRVDGDRQAAGGDLNLERTAPYYYSDLKSKEQQQALLNIVQQKSLSPPPKLLSRSTDQSSTRLALKSATMHFGHARTLSENLQSQRVRQTQQVSGNQNSHLDRLGSSNTSNTIARNIDRLFESPVKIMTASKSMLALNDDTAHLQNDEQKMSAPDDRASIDRRENQINKSKSMDNINRDPVVEDKSNPVYENICHSNKLMAAINDSAHLSKTSRGGFYATEQQHRQATTSSEESMDSILGSSMEDSDSNPDIIDEVEISSTENHLHDINEVIEQLKSNHSKLTEEYKSTLIRISRTIETKDKQQSDATQSAKLARRLKLLEIKSRKCESRSKNQLALIHMMEKVLRQSKSRTGSLYSNIEDSASNRLQSYPSGSDSGQPTSFECESTNGVGSSSNSKQSYSSSSQDRLSSSSCLSLDSQQNNSRTTDVKRCLQSSEMNNNLENSTVVKSVSRAPGKSLIEWPVVSTTHDQAPSQESVDQKNGNKSGGTAKELSSDESDPTRKRIIKAIVTESSQVVELVKAAKPTLSDATNNEGSHKDQRQASNGIKTNRTKRNNAISKRILDIEKRSTANGAEDQVNKLSSSTNRQRGSNPFCNSDSTDGSVSLSSTDEDLPSTSKAKMNAPIASEDQTATRHTNSPMQDGDDDFIEFLNSDGLSGQFAHFGASQFSASDFQTTKPTNSQDKQSADGTTSGEKLSPMTNKVEIGDTSQIDGSLKLPFGILKNRYKDNNGASSSSEITSNARTVSEQEVICSPQPSKQSYACDLETTNSDEHSKLQRKGVDCSSDNSSISTSEQLVGSKLQNAKPTGDKFTTVLGNVIDVDVCPSVNNHLSQCPSMDN